MRAILQTALSGRAGVRAMRGPCGSDGGRRRYDAASPEPMYRVLRASGVNRTASLHPAPTTIDQLRLGGNHQGEISPLLHASNPQRATFWVLQEGFISPLRRRAQPRG